MKYFILIILLSTSFVNAQDTYNKLWDQVEELELEGKYKSASEIVDKILKKAVRTKITDQTVKGFIYKSKFTLLLEENARPKIIDEIEALIKESDFPLNALLESVYASYLRQYFNRNRYTIQNRTNSNPEVSEKEFETWDVNTFVLEITKHYENSIKHKSKLKLLPIGGFEAILTDSKTSNKFRPTLYDFLAHRALEFFEIDKWYVTRAKERFYINNPIVFENTNKFVKEPFKTNDSIFSNYKTLKVFQELESFHLGADTTAYVNVVLDRLNFVRSEAILDNKDVLYINALSKLSEQYRNHESSATIDYEIADYYYQASNNHNAKKDPILKDYRIKALEICNNAINRFPNSDGGLLCTVLRNKIMNYKLDVKIEKYVVPEKPFLVNVEFKGMDSLYISAFKIPFSKIDDLIRYRKDSLALELIRKITPEHTSFYKLQKVKDYYEYTTELALPPLPIGYYIIVASKNKTINGVRDIYCYQTILSSNLTLLTMNNSNKLDLRVLNRHNGGPLKNVHITVSNDNNDLNREGTTDENGIFSIARSKKYYQNVRVMATNKGDTLVSSDYLYLHSLSSNTEENEERIAKMTLFLDRSIYRPGQIVYFKGILTELNKGVPKVVPNTYTTVTIYDANGDELKEFRLKTNEYGSLSGEFKIPLSVMTGEFSIEMDEDYGTDEEDEDPYYDKIDDSEYVELTFNVEEYKRPTFEVTFDDVVENYKIGDSIKVNGKANAFLGSFISNAKVKYSVTRDVLYNMWRGDYINSKKQIIVTGETKTDNNGEFVIPFIAYPDSLVNKNAKPIFNYTVTTDVIDVNGETRSSTKDVKVGYHNLKIEAIIGSKLNSKEEQNCKIVTQNLNGKDVDAEVLVSIFKLNNPKRTLRKKPWDIVELNSIKRDEFIKLFPNEVYDSTDVKEYWTKGNIVYNKTLGALDDKNIILSSLEEWKPGLYALEVKATDVFKDTLIVKKQFEIFNPEDNFLADNQLFEYDIVNHNYKQDGFVDIKLKTSADTLNVIVDATYEGKTLLNKIVTVDKGTKIIRIPVSKKYTDKISFNVGYVKYNSFSNEQFNITFPEVKNELNIETITFRDKLRPDSKEIWNFKISDSKGKSANAEVLASMYDTSLDQFVEHRWDTNISPYQNNYYKSPWYQGNETFSIEYFHNFRFIEATNLNAIIKNYHRLNFFGFDFGYTDYSNKKYISGIKNKIDEKDYVEGNISGIITDESGLPLPGVNVMIKGTTIGTQTDFDGFYTINAPSGSILDISYIGYKTSSTTIEKSGTYNFALNEDSAALDEVVIVGYGVVTNKNALGSVVIEDAEDLEFALEDKLGGKAAGVEISQLSGAVGSPSTIMIRGLNSVTAESRPLFIIDGIPMNLETGTKLDVTEIADITVLKGASATSLYGAAAANGVVIISTKKGLESLNTVETRNDLKETAFFFPHLRTNAEGDVVFSFDSPQALTKWKMSLFAHNKNLEAGILSKFAVTQKDINIIPNTPRFLREGDTIIISAKINNLSNTKSEGNSMLRLFDAITLKSVNPKIILGDSLQHFSIPPKGNSSLSWKLKIPKGTSAIEYKIVAKAGDFSDGQSNILPVLSNRQLVTEARSLWIPKGATKKVEFEKMEFPFSDTQENHRLTLEYSSNPAWLAIKSLPYLMQFPYECAEQTFSKYYANALAYQIINDNPKIGDVFQNWKENASLDSPLDKNESLKSIIISETPWVQDLNSDKENKARLANLFDREKLKEQELQTVSKLNELQMPSGAFPWFSGGNENEFITRHIICGIGHLKKLKVETENSYKLKPIADKALNFLDSKFLERYNILKNDLKDSTDVSLSNGTLHYLYARSFFIESHPLSKDLENVIDIYLNKGENNWLNESLYNKTLIALSLSRFRSSSPTPYKILDALGEQAIISDDNGMYWKENTRSLYWYKAPIETQALIIEAFSEIDNDVETIEKLKQWLIKNKSTSQWPTTKATTEAIYALLKYGKDWMNISENTVINIGKEKIKTSKLEPVQKEARTGYFKVNWTKAEITPEMSTIKVQNKGEITGFGGVYWQYFEDLDKITTSDNTALRITKKMFIKTLTDDGETLVPVSEKATFKLGDLITVRLEVKSTEDLEFIHLKDLRASGLEPIDVLSEYKWQEGVGYYQSTRDVATHFFFDRLPKGTYVFEYELRANNVGEFSNGIATIQSMYAPEFTNNSSGTRIKIDTN